MTIRHLELESNHIIAYVNQGWCFPIFLFVANEPCAFLENHYRSNWQRRRLPAYDASRNDRLMRVPVINYGNTDTLFRSKREQVPLFPPAPSQIEAPPSHNIHTIPKCVYACTRDEIISAGETTSASSRYAFITHPHPGINAKSARGNRQ